MSGEVLIKTTSLPTLKSAIIITKQESQKHSKGNGVDDNMSGEDTSYKIDDHSY